MTVRLSDPKPAFCSACHNSPPDARFVDFDAAHDGGNFVDRETQAYIEGSDDLHLCEACVQVAVEVLGLKPTLHANQRVEIGRLMRELDEWKSYARKLEGTLEERPETVRRPRRKVAA